MFRASHRATAENAENVIHLSRWDTTSLASLISIKLSHFVRDTNNGPHGSSSFIRSNILVLLKTPVGSWSVENSRRTRQQLLRDIRALRKDNGDRYLSCCPCWRGIWWVIATLFYSFEMERLMGLIAFQQERISQPTNMFEPTAPTSNGMLCRYEHHDRSWQGRNRRIRHWLYRMFHDWWWYKSCCHVASAMWWMRSICLLYCALVSQSLGGWFCCHHQTSDQWLKNLLMLLIHCTLRQLIQKWAIHHRLMKCGQFWALNPLHTNEIV